MLNDDDQELEHFHSKNSIEYTGNKITFSDEEARALKRLAQASVFLRYVLAPILTAIAAFIAAGDSVQHFLNGKGAL
jgi:hypothetical protein